MDENIKTEVVEAVQPALTFWGQHRYLLLIAIAIAIAIFLTGVSMALYNSSGAAQLDLSRPGYSAVTSQAVKNDSDFANYANTGTLDKAAIDEFRDLYDKQATKAKAVDAFSGDPLDPATLEISAPTASN
jgi:uncharacterized iron-regulated membrane protein